MQKKLFYTVFTIEGLNRERFFNTLQKKGITAYNLKTLGAKKTEFAIDSEDLKKFFAITEDLCYNIKQVRKRGVLAPFAALFSRFGVLVGALLFTAAAVAADFAVFSVDYSGSGAIYEEYAGEVLASCGVVPFSFTNAKKLETASKTLLKDSETFSFVSVEKRGTHVKVHLVLSPEASGVVDTNRKELLSPADGIVESVTVLRGTALVSAGDAVKKGDALIGGYNEIKDTVYETYVLGTVNILCVTEYTYLGGENDEEKASAFAAAETDGEIIEETITKEPKGDKFLFRLVVKYRIKVK